MVNIAVVGDKDSIYGFSALGVDTYYVREEKEVKECFRRIINNYAIIYITEAASIYVMEEIDIVREKKLPAVILIPGAWGNNGAGVEGIKKSVEQAVGSDILFKE